MNLNLQMNRGKPRLTKPKVSDDELRELLFGDGSKEDLETRDKEETYSFIQILKSIQKVQDRLGKPALSTVNLPPMLLIDHTEGKKSQTFFIGSSIGGQPEFKTNMNDRQIIGRFGDMSAPNEPIVIVREGFLPDDESNDC